MRPARLAATVGFLALASATGQAAAVLRSAESRIEFRSPTGCLVDLTMEVDGASEIEHRLAEAEGSRAEVIGVHGATVVAAPQRVGATRALMLRPGGSSYTIRYAVEQPQGHRGRCPLWIPTVPAAGGPQAVRLVVRVPSGGRAAGTMPAFAWTGEEGVATLGHLPAFVRVPYTMPGTPAPWNAARVMDIIAVATLVGATLAWARRRPRGLAR